MTLLSYARYVALTGDTTTASATAASAIADAQDMLEEELGRVGLLEDPGVGSTLTERLKVYSDGILGHVVYPSALPILDDGDYTQAGSILASVTPDASPFFGFGTGEHYATVA